MNDRELAILKSKVYKKYKLRIITDLEYANMKKETGYYIHTENGREVLAKNGYYNRKEITQRIGSLFNHFDCIGCENERYKYDPNYNNCGICQRIQKILNLF